MSEFSLDTLLNLINKYPNNIMDIKYNYLLLLSELTLTNYLDTDVFINNIKKISDIGAIFVIYVSTPDKETFDILASGTVVIEPKIIREGRNVGHIEDIVVASCMRNRGLCQRMLDRLKQYARENDCYKVILDCRSDLKQVYAKNGFQQKGIQMAEYFV